MFLLFNACAASAVSTLGFLQAHVLVLHILILGSVEVFLEHGIRLYGFELGLEIGDVMAMGAAIGSTTGIGEIVTIVLALIARVTPSRQCSEQ